MKFLDHWHCDKALSSPTILTFVELFPFIFCFRDISIINPDTMDIIAPVCPLQFGCAAKEASTYHVTILKLLVLSISDIFRVPLMYLITLTSFTQSYLPGILTWLHIKVMAILVSLMAIDVTNSSYATVLWNYVSHSLFSSVCLSSGLTRNI